MTTPLQLLPNLPKVFMKINQGKMAEIYNIRKRKMKALIKYYEKIKEDR